MTFKESSLNEVSEMIEKLDRDDEIVHPANAKSKSVKALMNHFSGSEDFHVFTYSDNQQKVVGFTSTFPNIEEERISIGITYILPEMRGKGYGYLMRSELVNWARAEGFNSVFARTWSGNTAMLKLNSKMGFKEIGRKEGVRGNGDDTVMFLLEFPPSS